MDEPDDVATLCVNIAVAVVGHGDLDAAIADLHRLPPGLQARGKLAAGLLEALMRTNLMSAPRRLRALDGLLEIADGPRPPTPQWIRTRTAAQLTSLMRVVAERELTDPDAVTARLDALARENGADPALKPLFDGAYMIVRMARAVEEGDAFALTRLPDEVRRFLGGMPQHDPRLQSLGDWLITATDFIAADQRDDLTAGLRQIMLATEGLPPGDLRDMTDDFASTVSKLMGMTAGGGGERLTDEQLAQLQARSEQPDLGDTERALRHTAAAGAALRGGQETDLGRVESGITHLRQALKLGDPGDSMMRVFHLCGLAVGLMRRNELTNATADLRAARPLLEEARTVAGGPQHPHWQMLNEMLTNVRRMLGDGQDFHRSALEGLRARVWQVLVQQELAGATVAVRGAATDAIDTARTCLVADDPAGAISALDAGRGLALFAATEIRTIADRLDEAGNPELAQRWRTAAAAHDPAQLPPDLRRDVLTVLTAHSSAAALLDPPELGEIQQALAAVDADALVYLVPGAGVVPGYAVVAPATGPPSYLALPNLQVEGDPDIERYLATLARRDTAALGSSRSTLAAARDLVPVDDAVDDAELAGSLDTLCGWAWGAAMGPLIESYLSRLPQPESGRPHRVVLVPMGDLARIPWQAARRKDGRYAIALIAISQAASARMLCRSAALPPVPPSPVGLLVGDPDTTDPTTGAVAAELSAARLEAYAIRQTFYRGARYIGRRQDGLPSPSGVGTSDQVRDWLTASGPAAGAMLHLACHGFVQTGTDQPTAYLLLAGGEKLTAEELIALMARAPDRAIGLVVLAACRTGLSINGYDEAYSLGTAFLAGGVRSVLSTQWSIPDRDTSVLMFMFHYFLRTGGRTAWAALREAQLWMLDPARVVPDQMPSPLRRQLGSADLGAVAAWAAFVHWGQ